MKTKNIKQKHGQTKWWHGMVEKELKYEIIKG